MKGTFFAILFVILFALPVKASPPDWCVRILIEDSGDDVIDSAGSGCLISPEYIITNYHIAVDSNKIHILFSNWDTTTATLVKKDKIRDLALLKIDKTYRKPCTLASRSRLSESVSITGYGQGLWGVGQGKVSKFLNARRNLRETHLLVTGYGARPGDSGGAVLNAAGELVGINSRAGATTTVIIRVEEIKSFVKDKKITLQTSEAPVGWVVEISP